MSLQYSIVITIEPEDVANISGDLAVAVTNAVKQVPGVTKVIVDQILSEEVPDE